MSRLNKTIRLQMLKAIVADSVYANKPVTESEIVKKHAHALIEKIVTPEVIERWEKMKKLADESSPGLPLTVTGLRLVTKDPKDTSYAESVYVNYRHPKRSWQNNVNVCGFEKGTLIPGYLSLHKDYPLENEALIEEIDKIAENQKEHAAFSAKVMKLLSSVNTINQLKKTLPQFEKYIPEHIITKDSEIKKTDIKDVMASLNQ